MPCQHWPKNNQPVDRPLTHKAQNGHNNYPKNIIIEANTKMYYELGKVHFKPWTLVLGPSWTLNFKSLKFEPWPQIPTNPDPKLFGTPEKGWSRLGSHIFSLLPLTSLTQIVAHVQLLEQGEAFAHWNDGGVHWHMKEKAWGGAMWEKGGRRRMRAL